MKQIYLLIFLILLIGSITGAILLNTDLVHTILLLVLLGVVLLNFRLQWDSGLALLCSGELCCIAAANTQIWLIVPLQIAVIGLFAYVQDMICDQRDILSFIVLCAIVGLITYFISRINHVLIPIVLICLCGVIGLIYALISLFRLKRHYAGESL